MTDSYQPPITSYWGPPPPPPEWVAAPPPWMTAPPPPAAPPPPGPRWGRAIAATCVAIALVAALIAIGRADRWRLHGARPTFNATTPVSPVTPAPPVLPTAPTPATGGGSSSNPPVTPPQTAAAGTTVTAGVVDVNTQLGYQNGTGAGTGMVLTPSGEILTNNHVIDGATSITVTLVETGATYRAAVVGDDPTEDVAILRISGASGLKTIPIGDSSTVGPGDSVVAMGNAGGVGGAPAVVSGTVRATDQTITASDPGGANAETLTGLLEIDAPLQPGDSGGPLVNSRDQVIGMNTAASAGRRFQSAANVGFAIPINHAISIGQQIESGHPTATVHIGVPGFIGVVVDRPSSANSSAAGAVIAGVEPGTPAAAAGLVAGDIVTSINGQRVDSAQTLSTLTKGHRPGDTITIGWTDQSGVRHTARLTLAAGPAD